MDLQAVADKMRFVLCVRSHDKKTTPTDLQRAFLETEGERKQYRLQPY